MVSAIFNVEDEDAEPRRLRLWEALDVSDSAEGSGEGGVRDLDIFDGAFERAPGGLRDFAHAGASVSEGTSKTANSEPGSIDGAGTACFMRELDADFARIS